MKTLKEYYISLLESMLTEAQNYENMFADLLKQAETPPEYSVVITPPDVLKKQINSEIDWARKTLKKNDRIVWYLRWARFWLFADIFGKQKALAELNKTAKTNYTINDVVTLQRLKINLEHFMSLTFPAIQNYTFQKQKPAELFDALNAIEKESQSKIGDDAGAEEMFSKGRLIEKTKTDDAFLRFPDGFAWVDLDTPADDDEGAAMGHCGNRASYRSDETILSLRKTVNYQGKQWWYPVCTFILDGNGELGEMKGRGNQKPQDRYHPYIIALLKSKKINGIKGGGYLPENNFSLNDLSDSEKNDVIAHNPDLAGPDYLYDKEGMSKRVIRLVERGLENNSLNTRNVVYDKEKKAWEVYSWNNFSNFIRAIDDRTVASVLDVAQGDADWQISDKPKAFRDMILSLPYDWQQKALERAGITGRNDSDLIDAADLLVRKDDEWFIVFQNLLQDKDLFRDQAWERLKQYVDIGWYFDCGGYVNIPDSVEELKKFIESDESVILRVDEKSMIDIATYTEGEDYYYEFNVWKLRDSGWDSMEDDYIDERRREENLVTNDGKDTLLSGVDEDFDLGDEFVNFMIGGGRSSIRDPRQGELPVEESLLERIKRLAGIHS